MLYSFLNLELISCSTQGSDCCFLASIQVSQETGKMVWYSISLRAFHSLKLNIQKTKIMASSPVILFTTESPGKP